MSNNSLAQLKATGTVVVTDTGEFECEYCNTRIMENF